MGTQKERIEQLETSLARLTERFDFLQTTLQLLAKGGTGALSWSQFCYSMQLLEAEVIVRGDKRPQEQCYIRTSQEATAGGKNAFPVDVADRDLARRYLDLCLTAPNDDTALLDWCADNRVVDGFSGSYYAGVKADFDIDELTMVAIEEQDAASGSVQIIAGNPEGEARWNMEWRKQFRHGIREMIKLQAESKAKQEADKTKPEA